MTPEQAARVDIDQLLQLAGWQGTDAAEAKLFAAPGVAIREFPLKSSHGTAGYLLYVDAKAADVLEAKKQGVTISGVEVPSEKYTSGLPDSRSAIRPCRQ